MKSMKIKTYSEMLQHKTFEARYNYLKLGGNVGESTFGFDRYLNQQFYRSAEWKRTREQIIIRDNGCDLGLPGYEIHQAILVHHINPMNADDIIHGKEWILEPEFLITTTYDTHNAIHYGNQSLLKTPFTPRKPGDTKLW